MHNPLRWAGERWRGARGAITQAGEPATILRDGLDPDSLWHRRCLLRVRLKPDSPGGTAAMAYPIKHDHSEGQVARAIEEQTARVPSDTFLWAAVGAMGTSLTFQLMGNTKVSLFVGQWVPTLLIFGLYNKIVKELGHDRVSP
jgi:hypothetical protein